MLSCGTRAGATWSGYLRSQLTVAKSPISASTCSSKRTRQVIIGSGRRSDRLWAGDVADARRVLKRSFTVEGPSHPASPEGESRRRPRS
jgi:hypothetical protein